MFMVMFRAFVAACQADFNARFADPLCEVGIVREVFDREGADVSTVTCELNAVHQSRDPFAHEASGGAPFTFQFAFGACINAFLDSQIAKHRC